MIDTNTGIRNTSEGSLAKHLRNRERLVHTARRIVMAPVFGRNGLPVMNPDGTPKFEPAPAPKGSGTTLDLGKGRAARRKERHARVRVVKLHDNHKARNLVGVGPLPGGDVFEAGY